MLRLPGEPCSVEKIQTFASYVLNCNNKGGRQSSSSLIHRKGSFWSNSDKKSNKIKIRPQTSHIRKSTSKDKWDLSQLGMQGGQVLISPSNRNFKYFVNDPHANNIDCKFNNSNFLLQPCKIQSIPIKPRKQLLKQSPIIDSKYSSPFGEKIKFNTQKTSSSNLKNRPRQTTKSKPLKQQQLIEPWDISDCHFESIKLNQKNL